MSDFLSSANPAWLFSVVLEGAQRLSKGRQQLSVVRKRSERLARSSAPVDLQLRARELPEASDLPSLTRAAATALGPVSEKLELHSSSISAGRGASTTQLLRHTFYLPGDERLLGSLVEKVIERPARKNSAYLWTQEAAVYAQAEKFKDAAGVRLPACHGLFYRSGRIHLYIEDIRGHVPPSNPRQLLRAAEALGCFGAWAAAEGLWKLSWLAEPSGSQGKLSIRSSRVEAGLDRATSSPSAAARLLEGYRAIRGALPAGMHLIQASPPTVVHLDAHAGNILLPKGEHRLCLLDWAKAGRGRLGDDLLRLASPRHYLFNRGNRLEEFLEAEAALLDSYLEGARACYAEVVSEDVRRYYYLRSLLSSVRWLERGGRTADTFLNLSREEQQKRLRAMEEFLLLQNERVRELLGI